MDSKKVISRKKFYPSIEKMLAGARFDLMVNTTDIESLATGIEPLIAVDHSLHVLEIIEAARKSQEEGRRIQLQSTFRKENSIAVNFQDVSLGMIKIKITVRLLYF